MTSACSSNLAPPKPKPQIVASPDKVSMMLANAADKASNALETLAAVEQTRTPRTRVGPVDDVPPPLKRAMTLNWVGPVGPALKKLADHAGYEFNVLGRTPPVPVIVSIDAENETLINIFRSIGLQLGPRATVHVDGTRKMVEIHYPPVTEAGTYSSTTTE